MKEIFIASFDMEIGGVERSLINLLNEFDYSKYKVDLMLYSHTGDFFNMIPLKKVNLLKEIQEYKTFRMGIIEMFRKGFVNLGVQRLKAKIKVKKMKFDETGYIQMQYMWKNSIEKLPNIEKEYEVAISYLWPHYCVAEKVKAKTKIAWIHTDYTTIETDVKEDLRIWNKFNYIVSISDSVTKAFLKKYPSLKEKIILVENITSVDFIKKMAEEKIDEMQNKDEFKLLTVARLSHAKGIDNGVKALKILHDKGFKNIKWYVVGYGGDEELVKKLIKENNLEDSFILLGKKINPYPYIKNCDLYVQPSRYEGKAVTVTEAQILGKAVMITNYETAKSQVEDGKNGIIVELSIDGIAAGIEKIYKEKNSIKKLEDECKKNKCNNYENLEKLYKFLNL